MKGHVCVLGVLLLPLSTIFLLKCFPFIVYLYNIYYHLTKTCRIFLLLFFFFFFFFFFFKFHSFSGYFVKYDAAGH